MAGIKWKDILAELPEDERTEIIEGGRELIRQEATLKSLRQAQALTQEHMAESLHISQVSVSRIEKRSDVLLSTLRRYVRAMGGHLRLVVDFPNQEPVVITQLSTLTTKADPVAVATKRAKGDTAIPSAAPPKKSKTAASRTRAKSTGMKRLSPRTKPTSPPKAAG
jgi:transcriptional regulator with XRE-family HTH domain